MTMHGRIRSRTYGCLAGGSGAAGQIGTICTTNAGAPEWVFSHWKYPGSLEKHRYFGLRRVSAYARWQMPMSLAAALVKALDIRERSKPDRTGFALSVLLSLLTL